MITELDPRLLSWASVIETDTVQQALKTSRLQIVAHHVALMPDAHVGIGSTVGSVIPTRGAVIPAAVGVDIGCGMVAAETDLRAEDLPDSLDAFLKQVPREIPAGVGQGHRRIRPSAAKWYEDNPCPAELSDRGRETALTQFGSLGSGNHFFEICLDERDVVWLVLHSGSRGIGNQLARQHIDKAKLLARENATPLEDPDLAFFLEGTPEFRAYIDAMLWAQRYASANRAEMVANVSFAFLRYIGKGGVVRTINASLTPIPTPDWNDPVRTKFRCASCSELIPWAGHQWGSWDTGETVPILVKRRDGRGVARVFVPIRLAGRTCAACTLKLTDWRKSKEPDVTVLRDEKGRAQGARAPKRGHRDKNHTKIWRTWYAATAKQEVGNGD